jgi:hypothetical protein
MKTRRKTEIINHEYIQTNNFNFLKILLIALCCVGLGLIPMVYGIGISEPGGIAPTETAL